MPQRWATLAPIRLTNAAAQLVLRTQVRRKEKRPHPSPHNSRPYTRKLISLGIAVELCYLKVLQCNPRYCMITVKRPDGVGAIIRIRCFIGMVEKQARADKSAVGAINRPLQSGDGWKSTHMVGG